MKNRITILLTIVPFFTGQVFSQTAGGTELLNGRVERIAVYRFNAAPSEKYFTVRCDFGKDSLQFNEPIDISKIQVTAIDLVFTDYPAANELKALNGRRLRNFFAHYPSLASAAGPEWRLVRQMDGTMRDKALPLFHGFVVYYRPLQNLETMKSDLARLKVLLTPVPAEGPVKKHAFLAGDTTHLRERYEIEPYTIVKKMPVLKTLSYLGLDPKDIKYYTEFDSLYVYELPQTDSIREKTVLPAPEDSTVIHVFDRITVWKNMLVVTDVTASMYPYTGQLLCWLKKHEDERAIRQFIFFNDGDDRDEDKKSPGLTGGIYSSNSSVFEVVEELAFKAMSHGNGGAIPENNLEALLSGMKQCPNCNDVVMIADNNSPVSDMVLLDQVTRPVHIIACGVHEIINPDLLKIARVTGGSVHLMEEDLFELNKVKENQTIILHGRSYTLLNGKFILKN